MATLEETLKKIGLATARGVPQLATGFVDLAALPLTATGMLKPEQVVGSTAYLTSKGLLPQPQPGLLAETTELVSSAMNPASAVKSGLIGIGGTFIGKNAKTWNKAMESKFLELEKSGVSPEDIWKQTGTVRAPDGKLRQEISDVDMKFKTVYTNKPQKLGEAISHEKLFEAYPDLKNVEFVYAPPSSIQGYKGNMGENIFGEPSMQLSQSIPLNKDALSTVLHEGKHWIQGKEGFSPGANLQMITIDQLPKAVVKKAEKLRDKANNLYEANKFQEAQDLMSKANKTIYEGKYRAYKREFGEAEARLVQTRMDLTDAERLANYPYSFGGYGLDVNPKKVKAKGLLE